MTSFWRFLRIGLLCAALGGCASTQGPTLSALDEPNDPFEPFNRAMFAVNQGIDTVVIRPAAVAYDAVTPTTVRHVLRNVTSHIGLPITLANAVLQGDWDHAQTTFWRLFVNTTLGGLGLLDPATDLGLPLREEDFGQTLAVAGIEEGPYLFLPLLGPVPPRDLVGRIVDHAFNPLMYLENGTVASVSKRSVEVLEFRAENMEALDELYRTSPDFYAAIRSAYRQRRNAAILNGELDTESLPDISAVSDTPRAGTN
ncbi:MlaA family lipoprotein [Futiania mangrovi]|uniref:VacJ family lipoprotein n=1 Tax=Futiania mangrovi TaxID=2959716 RepID=A0A9J6PFQ1_9PROT|nr:VacJ family lipoprotein [Futiania mangrovii]MCP1334938.1 VacJ family lipoprotein [Futiania mangrovii]